MKVTITKNNDDGTGESWWGETGTVRVTGDEFEVHVSEAWGIRIYPKSQGVIPQHPIFVLPLPLPGNGE